MSGNDKKMEELVSSIKEILEEITSGEVGMLVNLRGVVFPEGGRGGAQSTIAVSCLFINEEGSVCADLFRNGTAGFMECVYGSIISTIREKGLEKIRDALLRGEWSLSENLESISGNGRKKTRRKKSRGGPFKFSFMARGA
ncbi:MAG TPA: hypothetical protein PK358_08055 [Spirochaetota bacterium]|nr:hypothetical protein [Spirochaetota bacterium]